MSILDEKKVVGFEKSPAEKRCEFVNCAHCNKRVLMNADAVNEAVASEEPLLCASCAAALDAQLNEADPDEVAEWWSRFNNYARDLYDAARSGLEYAERIAWSFEADAIEGAVVAGLLHDAPLSQLDVYGLPTVHARVESLVESGEVARAVADEPELAKWMLAQLTTVYHAQTLAHWDAYYWHFMGDEAALDWNDPAQHEDFERRFHFMLSVKPEYCRLCNASGLALSDLFDLTNEDDANETEEATDATA